MKGEKEGGEMMKEKEGWRGGREGRGRKGEICESKRRKRES